MIQRSVSLFALAALMMCSSVTYAWNNTGHMVIAEIAYQNLTEPQRLAVADILKQHPHYKLFLSADLPAGVSEEEWAFCRAATWPDWVRSSRPGDKQFKDATITHYSHSTWHYENLQFVADHRPDAATTQPAVATTQPVTREVNLLQALADNRALLADANTPAADRAVALCWVLHLTGDLHQPLHAATMFSSRFPQGDKGGNDQCLYTPAGVSNLHAIWDEALGTAQTFTAVAFLARDITRDARNDLTKLDEFRLHKTFPEWADESHDLAVGFVYLDGRLQTALMKDYQAKTITLTDVPNAPPMYLENVRDVGRTRIALAGARLGEMLQGILQK